VLARTRIAIATLAVTGLALTAAGPASAVPRVSEPAYDAQTTERTLDQPVGTKSCTIEVTGPDGKKTTLTYPPGTKIKMNGREYECQDGTWMPTDPVGSVDPTGGYVFEADGADLEQVGTRLYVNLRVDHSYSNDGGYHAEP
jgi:hypothetical protein